MNCSYSLPACSAIQARVSMIEQEPENQLGELRRSWRLKDRAGGSMRRRRQERLKSTAARWINSGARYGKCVLRPSAHGFDACSQFPSRPLRRIVLTFKPYHSSPGAGR